MKKAFLLLLFLVPFQIFAYKIHFIKVKKQTYIQLAGLAKFYGYKHQKIGKNKEKLQSNARTFTFASKEKFFLFEKSRIYLSYTPQVHKNLLYIHHNDYYKLLDPILRHRKVSPKKTVKRILIDPGHGGKDSGAQGKYANEKTINMKTSLKLKASLEKVGYKVFLTRWSDRFPSFKERTDLIKKFKADIFISIHSNATKTKSVSGIETFHLTPNGGISSNGGKKARKGKSVGDKFTRESARLAYEVHRQFAKYTGAQNRGVKNANFKVLRESDCPSILVETGFLSNRWEEKRLSSKEYQQRLADCIVRGVYYYHLSLK